MADLSQKDSSGSMKVAGADPATGVETFYLAVDSEGRVTITGSVIVGGLEVGDRISLYDRDTIVSFPDTPISYTVPAGKRLNVENWSANTENSTAQFVIEVDSGAGFIEKSSMRFDSSSDTGLKQYIFGVNSPLAVEAGEVVQLRIITGTNNKEYITSINGFLQDV